METLLAGSDMLRTDCSGMLRLAPRSPQLSMDWTVTHTAKLPMTIVSEPCSCPYLMFELHYITKCCLLPAVCWSTQGSAGPCRSVNLERITDQHGQPSSQELCRNDPQLPQGFTPLKQDIAIRPGDTLQATCMFDSSNQTRPVKAGSTHNDEMCNLYLMLYSQLPYFMSCYGSPQIERHGTGGIPAESTLEVGALFSSCYYMLSRLSHANMQSLLH